LILFLGQILIEPVRLPIILILHSIHHSAVPHFLQPKKEKEKKNKQEEESLLLVP